MTEQQYRVHACDSTEPHEAHQFRGTYQKRSLPGVEITETFQCEGIERPVPTTDEQPRTGVSTDRLRDMADLLDGLLNRATLRQAADELDRLRSQHPSVPTHEQIAEAIAESRRDRNDANPKASHWPKMLEYIKNEYRADADAVLALIQKGTDR